MKKKRPKLIHITNHNIFAQVKNDSHLYQDLTI